MKAVCIHRKAPYCCLNTRGNQLFTEDLVRWCSCCEYGLGCPKGSPHVAFINVPCPGEPGEEGWEGEREEMVGGGLVSRGCWVGADQPPARLSSISPYLFPVPPTPRLESLARSL